MIKQDPKKDDPKQSKLKNSNASEYTDDYDKLRFDFDAGPKPKQQTQQK
jgi:hypothetical protein